MSICPVYASYERDFFLAIASDGVVHDIIKGQGVKGAVLQLNKAVCLAAFFHGKFFPTLAFVAGIQRIGSLGFNGQKNLSVTGLRVFVSVAAAADGLMRQLFQYVLHIEVSKLKIFTYVADSIARKQSKVKKNFKIK